MGQLFEFLPKKKKAPPLTAHVINVTEVNKNMSHRQTQIREMNGQADVEVDYKRKYKNLKRKLKFLVYEQECFQEELRRAQRKLLKVSRDKSFLLDRLLQYERVDEDSSDSEATVSSENSEGECPREREREREGAKKRRPSPGACLPSTSPHLSLLSRPGVNALQSSASGPYLNTMPFPPEYLAPPAERMKKEKKTKTPKNKKETTGKVVAPMATNYPSATTAPTATSGPFSWVPRQMLSGDAAEEDGDSDGDSDRGDEDRGEGDEAELVIDIPNDAAAAAVWLLAVLGPGLSLPDEDSSEPGVSQCSHCFYRQTPPQGVSAGPSLRPLCHRLPGGQAFATLSRPTCDTAVYSAFHLSHGWTEREGEEGGELLTEEDEANSDVAAPALLRGHKDASDPASSPLQQWDTAISTLVQSNIGPQCDTLGGDLYILTGVGGLGSAEDGDEEEGCQTKPLWCAVCCAVSEGKSGFSVGLIRETEEGERQVSVKELGEMLGGAELFSEGCREADGETAGITVGLRSDGEGNTETLDVDLTEENTGENGEDSETADTLTEGEEDDSDTTVQGSNEDVQKSDEESLIAGEQAADSDPDTEEAAVADVTQETSESSAEGQEDVTPPRADRSEAPESSTEQEAEDAPEADTNSTSTFLYVLSTTLSILKAPLRPVFSTITQLPGQVIYVLQEDLGVLFGLPGETFSFFHLLTSDLLSWMSSAAEMLLGIGETCCCSMYYCASTMLGALLDSCHTGVTGMGSLAGDTVGIFGGALDNGWWVTKFFGGRLWEQSEGYVGTVMSEMGGQAKTVGGGFGRLVWRSGNGVGNVFRLVGSLIMGVVEVFIGAMRGAFGQESE
ncbi:uncharacterized protein V6R79_002694 [Siganus canaliculatus]